MSWGGKNSTGSGSGESRQEVNIAARSHEEEELRQAIELSQRH